MQDGMVKLHRTMGALANNRPRQVANKLHFNEKQKIMSTMKEKTRNVSWLSKCLLKYSF